MTYNVERIAEAIHVINKHAKLKDGCPDFYHMKNETLQSLIYKGEAKKLGLDIYKNVKSGKSKVLTSVQIGNYHFHIPPTEEDFINLSYLNLKKNKKRRNNLDVQMDFAVARYIILKYLRNNNSHYNRFNAHKPISNIPPYQDQTTASVDSRKTSNEKRSVSSWFEI